MDQNTQEIVAQLSAIAARLDAFFVHLKNDVEVIKSSIYGSHKRGKEPKDDPDNPLRIPVKGEDTGDNFIAGVEEIIPENFSLEIHGEEFTKENPGENQEKGNRHEVSDQDERDRIQFADDDRNLNLITQRSLQPPSDRSTSSGGDGCSILRRSDLDDDWIYHLYHRWPEGVSEQEEDVLESRAG
ncbi:hypothetical protein L1987_58788 [Smallanthus sonchifolius]|uniref:Uncharacterized protein n=1 Tax=Smallanthus sonchifolius TaxID=185202 RepID=A0ACB9D3M9_9ASTR|nr:hypothetical protein L1987_58788 [Smallanthus sonchifolius]